MNYFKSLYKRLFKIKNVLLFEVPMNCNTREEKDKIIFSTIEALEQSINIINK